jgi:hypothetical protein
MGGDELILLLQQLHNSSLFFRGHLCLLDPPQIKGRFCLPQYLGLPYLPLLRPPVPLVRDDVETGAHGGALVGDVMEAGDRGGARCCSLGWLWLQPVGVGAAAPGIVLVDPCSAAMAGAFGASAEQRKKRALASRKAMTAAGSGPVLSWMRRGKRKQKEKKERK